MLAEVGSSCCALVGHIDHNDEIENETVIELSLLEYTLYKSTRLRLVYFYRPPHISDSSASGVSSQQISPNAREPDMDGANALQDRHPTVAYEYREERLKKANCLFNLSFGEFFSYK